MELNEIYYCFSCDCFRLVWALISHLSPLSQGTGFPVSSFSPSCCLINLSEVPLSSCHCLPRSLQDIPCLLTQVLFILLPLSKALQSQLTLLDQLLLFFYQQEPESIHNQMVQLPVTKLLLFAILLISNPLNPPLYHLSARFLTIAEFFIF